MAAVTVDDTVLQAVLRLIGDRLPCEEDLRQRERVAIGDLSLALRTARTARRRNVGPRRFCSGCGVIVSRCSECGERIESPTPTGVTA